MRERVGKGEQMRERVCVRVYVGKGNIVGKGRDRE